MLLVLSITFLFCVTWCYPPDEMGHEQHPHLSMQMIMIAMMKVIMMMIIIIIVMAMMMMMMIFFAT